MNDWDWIPHLRWPWSFDAKAVSCLKTITVPAHIDGIPVYAVDLTAFGGCYSLEKLVISEGVSELVGEEDPEESCFAFSITLPQTLKHIRAYAFVGCFYLKKLVIPEGCIDIATGAFAKCGRIKQIFIPKSVTEIGDCAFENCEQLEEIIIESEDCKFGKDLLAGCKSIKRIVGPLNRELERMRKVCAVTDENEMPS